MSENLEQAAFGIPGLDDVLGGGLERRRLFLLEGNPGTGKTTLALQFVVAGAQAGERSLYITLAESEEELRAGAASHGFDLADVEIMVLAPPESLLEDNQQSLLYASDLELREATRRIVESFERIKPHRVVLDSLSEIRLLAEKPLYYRRQILALKHYFATHGAAVLLLDDLTTDADDRTVHSVAHGVIRLEQTSPEYGADRRRMRVMKYRGRRYREGYHDLAITTGGVRIFPRLISAEHKKTSFARDVLKSESAELDNLLGGGIERGSSILLLGPAGAGKSLLALTFVQSAIRRGETAAMFVFDEELGLLFDRAKKLKIDLQAMHNEGKLFIQQVDAAELSPGEFSERVRHCVEVHGVKTIVIDSLNGYQAAMAGEQALVLHIHELLQYLNRQGATTFLTVAQHGLFGDMQAPVDLTYLADTVVLLRYFEALGRVRRAISVVKKRTGEHEDTIREYRIGGDGFSLGEPLLNFQGVLRGTPTLIEERPGTHRTLGEAV